MNEKSQDTERQAREDRWAQVLAPKPETGLTRLENNALGIAAILLYIPRAVDSAVMRMLGLSQESWESWKLLVRTLVVTVFLVVGIVALEWISYTETGRIWIPIPRI